jgi:2-phosphosulfolactate phosphatase
MSVYSQDDYTARFEWGMRGLEELCPVSDVMIIVDVLSFTTGVDIAASRGATIFPYRMNDETTEEFAKQVKAQLAVSRKNMDKQNPFSLSPRSLMQSKSGDRIIVPSLNGATLSKVASGMCANVLAGCLRNAQVVAKKAENLGEKIAVIAAGESWNYEEGHLRPAFEDLIGAGAILSYLQQSRALSPEAVAAVGAFNMVSAKIEKFLMDCESGRELREKGFEDDIRVAAQMNGSHTVPMIVDGAFVDVYEMDGKGERDEEEVVY